MLNAVSDATYMAAAISLSLRGKGITAANPNVACLIVKDGKIIGRGWTQQGGRPHAEAIALQQAGKAAAESDVYTTLEPCAHQSDRGPACTDLLVEAKPRRVIIASLDPDKRTHGRGVQHLEDAGIEVSAGLLEDKARRAMAGFFCRMEKARPHVTLKLAMSFDGHIAMADGTSKWITGERARAHSHMVRAQSDAILVGSGTLNADQPRLDVRLESLEGRSPLPVLLGQSGAPDHWIKISSPEAVADLPDVNWLKVEGGASVAAAFLKANLVDRLAIYRAPIIIGKGQPAIGDIGLADLHDTHGLWRFHDRRQFDQDVLEVYDRAA